MGIRGRIVLISTSYVLLVYLLLYHDQESLEGENRGKQAKREKESFFAQYLERESIILGLGSLGKIWVVLIILDTLFMI